MFDIITPCTRKQNLDYIKASIEHVFKPREYRWHVVFDKKDSPERIFAFDDVIYYDYGTPSGVAGKEQINYALDHIPSTLDTWVYVLDDDTILHPLFRKVFEATMNFAPDKRALCFMQQVTPDRFRPVSPETTKVTHIDQGQYLLHRSLIGDRRFLQDYCADGHFIEGIYNDFPDEFVYANYPACYYNYLRWANG